MDEVLEKLQTFSTHIDNFKVGASSAYNGNPTEAIIKKLEAHIEAVNADILYYKTLINIAKSGGINKNMKEETEFRKYETEMAEITSCIKYAQNLVSLQNEATALNEALQMKPEEVEQQPLPIRNYIKIIKTLVPQISAIQLERMRIQKEISQKMRYIQSQETLLMRKKFKHAENLLKQKKQLEQKRSSEDEEYKRKKEELTALADNVNKMKNIIQGLIASNDVDLVKHKRLMDIIIKTRKPVDILTYEMCGLLT